MANYWTAFGTYKNFQTATFSDIMANFFDLVQYLHRKKIGMKALARTA